MNLSGLFQYGNKNTGSHGSEGIHPSGGGSVASGHARQAVSGQTIQGEIVSKNGREVQIRVDKDTVINARLDRDVNVSVGQSLTFEVKNSSGTQIALRPLYENLAQDANVLKALDAARLPATGELMRMVSAMMEQGMPIDRNTLLDMSRLVTGNGGVDPETVVLMKNMKIPVTPENIQQFENYRKYEHQILNNVTNILEEIPLTFQSMVNVEQETAAADFYMQLLQLFTGMQTEEGASDTGGAALANNKTGSVLFTGGEVQTDTKGAILETAYSNARQEMAESIQALGKQEVSGPVKGQEGDALKSEDLPKAAPSGNNPPQDGLSVQGREQLVRLLGKLGAPEELLQQIQNGTAAAKQLLTDIQALLHTGGDNARAAVLDLFGSKEYNQLLSREILQQWLIKPEEVAKKSEVEDFYSRLREQTTRLTQVLGQAAKDTPLARSLTAMQNNIEFMNQVNQMFNYIQLPLKMSGGKAHGDLYVYTNRKHTEKEDGSVSALLHLDMENLGPVDVHVLMREKNVSTRFYLADEGMIDFIAEHIHILDERLQKRGYEFHVEMLPAEEFSGNSENAVETMLAGKKRDGMLTQYSFDVRA